VKDKKTVWIKADSGAWDDRKQKITTGLESGVDFVLVNEEDVTRVKELGTIKVAAFEREGEGSADVYVIGKNSEGDGMHPLPVDFSGSRDINLALQLKEKGLTIAGYVVIKDKQYEEFAAELGKVCDYIILLLGVTASLGISAPASLACSSIASILPGVVLKSCEEMITVLLAKRADSITISFIDDDSSTSTQSACDIAKLSNSIRFDSLPSQCPPSSLVRLVTIIGNLSCDFN